VPAGVTEFYFVECTTYDVYAYYDEYDDTWYFEYIYILMTDEDELLTTDTNQLLIV